MFHLRQDKILHDIKQNAIPIGRSALVVNLVGNSRWTFQSIDLKIKSKNHSQPYIITFYVLSSIQCTGRVTKIARIIVNIKR